MIHGEESQVSRRHESSLRPRIRRKDSATVYHRTKESLEAKSRMAHSSKFICNASLDVDRVDNEYRGD
jgi:hypothetical protein